MMPNSRDRPLDRRAMYREMQRAIPGLDAMYRLVRALIASHGNEAPHVLVGAGGGREIEELQNSDVVVRVTAIDPSAPNLDTSRAVADALPELSFIVGTVEDVPDGEASIS